jgi:hypothetical protein
MTALYTAVLGCCPLVWGMTSFALSPKIHAKMTAVLDGILSTPCLVGGLGFVSEAARRPNYFLICLGLPVLTGRGAIQPGQGFLLRITRRTVSNSYSGISASGLNYIKSQRSAWGRICVAGSLASTSGVRSKAHSVGCTQSRVLLAAVPLAGLDMHEVIIKIPGASPNKQEFQFSTSRVYLQSDPFPS